MAANGKLTAKTLVPIGLLGVAAAAAWHISADRQKALAEIAGNKAAINGLSTDLDEMQKSLRRIEIRLGTLPNPQLPIPRDLP